MKSDSFRVYVLDQLRGLGRLDCRAMFGGHGLYSRDRFFGIVYQGRLYFKTDEASLPDYLAKGMKPFQPNRKQTLRSHYEVPADVLEDADELIVWARRAIESQEHGRHD